MQPTRFDRAASRLMAAVVDQSLGENPSACIDIKTNSAGVMPCGRIPWALNVLNSSALLAAALKRSMGSWSASRLRLTADWKRWVSDILGEKGRDGVRLKSAMGRAHSFFSRLRFKL